jgi:hypothetical protein
VGFSRGTEGAGGAWNVRSGDIVAWPEVEFEGVGWVPFFPTPGQATDSGGHKQGPEQKDPVKGAPAPTKPMSRAEKDREIAGQSRAEAAPDQPSEEAGGDAGTRWWLIAVVAVGTGVVGYLLLALSGPLVARRRRRHGGDPGDRVIGAWREVKDDLARAGMPASGSLTAEEVAAFGATRLPAPASAVLAELARAVNDIAYGGRVVEQTDADAAWRDRASVADAVRRVEGRPPVYTRVFRRLSPHSVAVLFRTPDGG